MFSVTSSYPESPANVVSVDGQTGYDLFWMSGELETRVMAGDDDTWEMEIRMTGMLSPPWPDKVTHETL